MTQIAGNTAEAIQQKKISKVDLIVEMILCEMTIHSESMMQSSTSYALLGIVSQVLFGICIIISQGTKYSPF